MQNILVAILSEMTTLSDQEMADIETYFPIKTVAKETFLLKEGQIAKDAYFVIKGYIRKYELIDGEEKTLDFFTENQSAANFASLANNTPSTLFLVCGEETTIAILNSEKEEALYKKHPRFESFCRTGMEQMMGSKQEELSSFIVSSPKERYLKLLKNRPELINRVPQYQLASYLGISPESLSRIRKRISQKE